MLSCPSGMTVSSRVLHVLPDALRDHKQGLAARAELTPGVPPSAGGDRVARGDGSDVGAAIEVAIGKAFVILDGTPHQAWCASTRVEAHRR